MSRSEWLTEQESFNLLERMFPTGLRSTDVLSALCPQGWQNSSSKRLFEGTRETTKEDDIAKLGYLIGLCLWDILSDNHDLILPDGRVVHLGSFRATAGIISDFVAEECPMDFRSGEGYLEFYLGTWAIKNRTALKPIYRHIFSRLRECDVDWKYSFPRLLVIRFKPEEEHFENYDPSAAFAAEQKEREENEQYVRMQEELEKLHQESIELARSKPPPETVQAYFDYANFSIQPGTRDPELSTRNPICPRLRRRRVVPACRTVLECSAQHHGARYPPPLSLWRDRFSVICGCFFFCVLCVLLRLLELRSLGVTRWRKLARWFGYCYRDSLMALAKTTVLLDTKP
jgi:hypothetical protein